MVNLDKQWYCTDSYESLCINFDYLYTVDEKHLRDEQPIGGYFIKRKFRKTHPMGKKADSLKYSTDLLQRLCRITETDHFIDEMKRYLIIIYIKDECSPSGYSFYVDNMAISLHEQKELINYKTCGFIIFERTDRVFDRKRLEEIRREMNAGIPDVSSISDISNIELVEPNNGPARYGATQYGTYPLVVGDGSSYHTHGHHDHHHDHGHHDSGHCE